MPNTLNDLVPDLYQALDVVSRELTGMIPSVSTDSGVERAAVGQVVRSFVAPESEATDIVPNVTPPDDGNQDIGNVNMTITKARRVPVRWNGEEQRGVNSGPGYQTILGQQFEQSIRTLTNEIEADLTTLHTTASRAFGVAGTTPFASDLTDTAETRKILIDNGSALSNMKMVMDTTAGAKMRTLTQLTKANEAADATLLRQGVLLDIHGIQLRESAQINTHVAGTASGATTNADGYAVGATVITLASAGTGTILTADAIAFAGDSRKYIITSGDTDVSDGGTITIAAPGLKQAIPTSATAITVSADSVRNMVFSKTAIVLATRMPALPEEGDQAVDRMTITDPRSGLSFEISKYLQYRQVQYEMAVAWGFKNFKTEHTALLLG